MKWLDFLNALPNTGRVALGSAAFLGIMMVVTKPKSESFGAESKRRGPFVFPKRKAYPIGDLKHAKKALIYSTWPDNKSEAKTVRRKVFKRYPKLRKWFLDGKYDAEEFGAESRFDKLADKIAKEYRKEGDSAEKAKEIGEATAAKIGRKKYGPRRFEEMAHGAESFDADEFLDYDFALFNCHINDALDKATKDFREKYGNDAYDDLEEEWLKRGGVMALITEMEPSKESMWFVMRNKMYVNGDTISSFFDDMEYMYGQMGWPYDREELGAESFEVWENPDICLMCGGPKSSSKVYCDSECSQYSNQAVRALGGTKGRGYQRGDIAKAVLTLKEYGGDMTANQWIARIRDVRPTRKGMSSQDARGIIGYLNPDVYVKTTGKPINYRIVSGNCYDDWVRERYRAESFEAEAHGDWLTCKDCYADRFIVSGVADDYTPECNACGSHNIAIMSQAESFEADPALGGSKGPKGPSDDDRDEPGGDYACYICNRPYEFSKLAISLAAHWFKESNGGEKDWKSKDNPDGLPRTARNLAGYYLATFGMTAIEEYIMELNAGFTRNTKITPLVVELLRRSIVPSVIAGDVVQFIETLEIEGLDEEEMKPKFGKGFTEEWGAE